MALGRLLASRCDALLLDEPYTGLDASLRRDLTELVRDLVAARQVPSVLVAHELEAAQAFADRMAVLDHGKILQLGTPAEVVAAPAARRVAELVGYRSFVPRGGHAGASVVAGVHPDRVVAGRQPGRGVVLAGAGAVLPPVRGRLGGQRRDGRDARAGPGAGAARRRAGFRVHGAGPALLRPRRAPGQPPRGGAHMTGAAACPAPTAGGPGRAVPGGQPGAGGPGGPGRPGPGQPDPGQAGRGCACSQARGYSQQQLAGMAGVSRQAVSAVEAGHSDPSLRVALALASALGVTVEELFGPGVPAPVVGARPVAPLGEEGARVTLAQVGDTFVALPLVAESATRAGFLPAGGLVAMPSGPAPATPVRPLGPAPADAGGGRL